MAAQVNEDELLRSPDVDSQDEMDRDELHTDDGENKESVSNFQRCCRRPQLTLSSWEWALLRPKTQPI
ncbi:hypothetical protein Y032_0030g2046 [Ancylostoma ceylanicum]|uniref:Uncharacterized protein n=1 Tax=Ancylostoma ceylanicum TaxID=53326 RepID=A0A016UR90_9BILA|nr:hypothetical protein Y032_0030g2046 [Ancylostoma ceylanicum]